MQQSIDKRINQWYNMDKTKRLILLLQIEYITMNER